MMKSLALISAVVVATVGVSAVSAADVWSDALLHIRGAVDRKND